MDGIIVLDKPLKMTSTRALDCVRRITGQRKSGHAGTLDPLATGVLVICLGKATKLVERVMHQPKRYFAVARLDWTTSSYDLEREVEQVAVAEPPDEGRVRAALGSFVGNIDQVPPRSSAIKVGGRNAYERERAGQAFELAARPVRIDAIRVVSYAWPVLAIEVDSGRGLYVRSLVRDIGVALGVGGCLTELRRLAVGPFRAERAWTLEALEAAPASGRHISLESLSEMLPEAPLPGPQGGVGES